METDTFFCGFLGAERVKHIFTPDLDSPIRSSTAIRGLSVALVAVLGPSEGKNPSCRQREIRLMVELISGISSILEGCEGSVDFLNG